MARKRPPPRTLEVLTKRQITPHMLRISLGGTGLQGFPTDSDGGYVKLGIGADIRTYTVRYFDMESGRLDVDFVLHDTEGPAADWARDCAVGDTIQVGGPGPKKPFDATADWILVAGDMSALPAICANIEALPPDASGVALLEIIDADDQQDIDAPEGFEIRWLINANPEHENSVLLDAVRGIEWQSGRAYCWVAGELGQSLAIRKFLRDERHVDRREMYVSSYWQIGQTEDGHRVAKRATADS